jgi:hypothetical protein
LVHIAAPWVAEISEQVRVDYRDAEQRSRHHLIDYVVAAKSGRHRACFVKAAPRLHAHIDAFKTIARCGTKTYHEWVCYTDRDFTDVEVDNARIVVECGLDQDNEGQALVRSILPQLGPSFHLSDIVAAAGIGARARRAAMPLIKSGDLVAAPGHSLRDNVLITVPATTAAA